jgi:hypothetical protein
VSLDTCSVDWRLTMCCRYLIEEEMAEIDALETVIASSLGDGA